MIVVTCDFVLRLDGSIVSASVNLFLLSETSPSSYLFHFDEELMFEPQLREKREEKA